MKPKDLDYVRDTIENEGFCYAFLDYSDFRDVDDAEFHTLRTDFVQTAEKLKDYLGVS